ncbi:hypothetical protein TIFTF001_022456 [Ficus carica]|uniref:EF-hand domain-containing protein n=1 Tax=Ficus carica TaxID=3494 RepID=A0AA88DCT7_FICCA|nr:hypothetical protein TIFTF001_022456 [Ficus carica]
MEELRLAAMAYYRNSSREFQDLAANFFKAMDTNGDGRVSFDEFTSFLRQHGYNWVKTDMFSQLDANNDGSLDFWEVMTFYYIIKTRAVWCDGCRMQLHGLHFICVACFDGGHNSYDLCARCYGGRNFSHHHNLFLDSYVLLRSKRGISPGMNVDLVCIAQAVSQPHTGNHSTGRNRWFRAMELAVNVGNLLNVGNVVGCSVM